MVATVWQILIKKLLPPETENVVNVLMLVWKKKLVKSLKVNLFSEEENGQALLQTTAMQADKKKETN